MKTSEMKQSLKKHEDHASTITLTDRCIVGHHEKVAVIAGPCSVESLEQMDIVAQHLVSLGVTAIRGGAFKPRTSPYSFQGLGQEGLEILRTIGDKYGLAAISEVMSCDQVRQGEDYLDCFQVGSRNMQNFELLKTLGKSQKPVLLKRGLSATIEEFMMSAEYIMANGNPNVILCERGIRSFDNATRNVLDINAVAVLKELTHLPIIVDPSHAGGKRSLVIPGSRAGVAIGADGLIVEAHPEPDKSVSDKEQALSLEALTQLIQECEPIALAVGRRLNTDRHAPAKVIRTTTLHAEDVNNARLRCSAG